MSMNWLSLTRLSNREFYIDFPCYTVFLTLHLIPIIPNRHTSINTQVRCFITESLNVFIPSNCSRNCFPPALGLLAWIMCNMVRNNSNCRKNRCLLISSLWFLRTALLLVYYALRKAAKLGYGTVKMTGVKKRM